MKIVLDANIIVADPWLQSNTFKLLFDNFERAGHSLFTPIIVLDEATNKYREKLHEMIQRLEKDTGALIKLSRQNLQSFKVDLDIEKSVSEYSQYLKHELNRARFVSARFIFYPDISHDQLV
jgi:predicted nucleic acid-binding protein